MKEKDNIANPWSKEVADRKKTYSPKIVLGL